MKRRLLIPLIGAAVALGSGVASANQAYFRQYGLLLEVSADPRDGTDFMRTDPTHATSLELIALKDTVRLRGLTIHFSDGRSMTRQMSNIHVGQPLRVDMPANCGTITGVSLDYGRQIVDRTPARLQIVPHNDGYSRYDDRYSRYDNRYSRNRVYTRDHRNSGYYNSRPVYVQPRPAPSTGWSIQGSFRF